MLTNPAEKLKKEILKSLIGTIAEKCLDFAEVAIASPETYKHFRSKILRIANDEVRNLHKLVDEEYIVFLKSDLQNHKPEDIKPVKTEE